MLRILCFLICLSGIEAIAQNTVKIVDSKTGEGISYANIMVDKDHQISNSEGYFTIPETKSSDETVVVVSYLGYAPAQTTVGALKNRDFTIALQEAAFELSEVNTSNVRPDPIAIMQQVKASLKQNYDAGANPVKNTIFWRKTDGFKPSVIDVEIEKSTGFSKQALKETNSDILKLTNNLKTHPPQEFTDMLVNYYSGKESKLEVVKATKLQDEKRAASLEGLEKSAASVFLKHIDTTKYYRFKSGWFGSRDTVMLRKDQAEKNKKKEKDNQIVNSKMNLSRFISSNGFLAGSSLDFVTHPEWYEYTYDGATYATADQFVWVLKFKPRKSKANYTGKLYISETDYAVVRADYELAKGKTLEGINIKLLLGIKFSQNVSKGTVIYTPNTNGNGYHLQYASSETGTYFYVHRPLKFIEITKEDKDVVALDIKVEGNMRNRTEFLNVSHNEVSADQVSGVTEKEFGYERLKKYDASVWKNYSALEPLEEMKKFEVEN